MGDETLHTSLQEPQSEEEIRKKKLLEIKERGVSPYPNQSHRTSTIAEARTNFQEWEQEKHTITIAGRIRTIRRHGGSTFAVLEDGTGTLQLYFKRDAVGKDSYSFLSDLIDGGDIIESKGTLFVTKKGEQTLLVSSWRLLAKSLLPLPEKWHGLTDTEIRYRKRYLDILANESTRNIFKMRAKFIQETRSFFDSRGFLEVETPILQPLYGGTNARPFVTHHHALDTNLYLRIAPELYLKRLIVGGFEKIYEIGKCFRNEGIDREHNPEFTMMEFYWAYADYKDGMRLTEEYLTEIISRLKGTDTIEFEGKKLHFSPPFPRISFKEVLLTYAGIDITTISSQEELAAEANKRGIAVEKGWGNAKILDELYKELARPRLEGPVFLVDHPAELTPLAKKKEDDERFVERYQLIIAGREIINAYTELNDPLDQRARFEEQERAYAQGDDEAQRIDEDYIEALMHGMPPTTGWGMGVDRMLGILTQSHNLKEVIAFPTLKPKK